MMSTWGYDELMGQVIVDGLHLLKGETVNVEKLDEIIFERVFDDDYNSVYKYFTYNGRQDLQDFLTDNWDEAEGAIHEHYRVTGEALTEDCERDMEEKVCTMVDYGLQETLYRSNFLQQHLMRDDITLTDDTINTILKDLDLSYVASSNWTYGGRSR